MINSETFFDTNILLYLLSSDSLKADKAEAILQNSGIISVQVLNEITNVTRKKLSMLWPEVNEVLSLICSICRIEPLTLETHQLGKKIAEQYGISVYDSMICASAVIAGCKTLYSEDMHHGLLINKQVKICNPFLST
jgi:predicted nucleic acid-binding protein